MFFLVRVLCEHAGAENENDGSKRFGGRCFLSALASPQDYQNKEHIRLTPMPRYLKNDIRRFTKLGPQFSCSQPTRNVFGRLARIALIYFSLRLSSHRAFDIFYLVPYLVQRALYHRPRSKSLICSAFH